MQEPLPEGYELRPIAESDNPEIARIIRVVMPEFGADGPGFAIHDAEVDIMAQAYDRPRAAYFVITHFGRILGGGGIAPLDGGDHDTCELRKMYFLPEARGLGLGRRMLHRCLQRARAIGFQTCYLETLDRMTSARRLYERAGFSQIDGPMGATGHGSCNAFYLLDLTQTPVTPTA